MSVVKTRPIGCGARPRPVRRVGGRVARFGAARHVGGDAALAEAAGATRYLTGPAARAYMDEAPFARRGIGLDWMAYPDYPAYPQLWGGFEPAVSIIDLLLNTGDAAPGLIWP